MRCRTTSSPSISISSPLSSSGVPPTSSSSTASEEGGTSGRPRREGSADKNLLMMNLLAIASSLREHNRDRFVGTKRALGANKLRLFRIYNMYMRLVTY